MPWGYIDGAMPDTPVTHINVSEPEPGVYRHRVAWKSRKKGRFLKVILRSGSTLIPDVTIKRIEMVTENARRNIYSYNPCLEAEEYLWVP